MPQALNRYTAGVMGQPGVLQSAAGDAFNWLPHFVNLAENTAVESARNLSVVTGYIYEGVRPVAVRGSRDTLTHHLPDALQEFPGRFVGSDPNDMFYRTRIRVRADSELRIGVRAREMATELTNAMPPGSRVQLRGGLEGHNWVVGQTWGQLEDVARLNKIRSGLGFGFDFVIGVGFQFSHDIQNPYLTPQQVVLRAGASGVGGAVVSALAVSAFCGPGAFACAIFAGVGGGMAWSVVVQPLVFQAGIFQPSERNLEQLTMP
jgi:hypothetical protein